MSNRIQTLLATALLALGLAACGNGGQKVTVKLTDAPGDNIEAAVVTISRVTLEGGGQKTDGELSSEGNGDVVLRDTPVTTNLLTLANDTIDLVDGVDVDAGTYKELRFVITGGYVQVREDGVSRIYATPGYDQLPEGETADGELHMPSYASSGLKVKFANDADVEVTSDGGQKVILVDFDVAQSFGKPAGGSNRWVMSPVIKGADLELSGNVEVRVTSAVQLPVVGSVQLKLDAFSAVLVNAEGSEEPLALTDADANGTYEADFKYLLPGAYRVQLRAPAGIAFTSNPGLPLDVTVAGGAETGVDIALTQVTAQ